MATLFAAEIRMLLRDRRTLIVTAGAPLVLLPLLIFVLRAVEQTEQRRIEEATYLFAVTGSQQELVRELLGQALGDTGASEAGGPDARRAGVRFEERPAVDPEGFLDQGRLHVVVEGLSDMEYRRSLEEGDDPDRVSIIGADSLRVPVIRLRYRAQSDFSRAAMSRVRERLLSIRREREDSIFRDRGFPVDPDQVAPVERLGTASAERVGSTIVGQALMPLLLLLMLVGGSIVASDTIAGEKERGTLETLLTTAAPRSDIVSAKQLAIIVVGIGMAVVYLIALLVFVVLGVFDLPDNLAVGLSFLDLLLLLVLFVPLAVLVCNALLLVSGYARSFKEYQVYYFPLFLVLLFPSFVAFLPGMELRSAVAVVPIAGIGVAVREILLGQYDVPFLLIAFLSTAAAAYGLSRLTVRVLSVERLISGVDLDEADLRGGPALFPRHVASWFLGLWVAFFLGSLWFGESLGLRGQIFVNLVVIFFGGTVVMVRRYRLPVREALALRPVHPAAWLAVLVGAPSAFLLGVGLSELVNLWLFPVPEQILEAFGDVVLAEELPLWQLLVFLSLMPAVFEELAFRGVLLHGVRRLSPWAICLVVGAVFGLFHVSLFRILPTAYLGAVLAAVVLLTGSIFPAMVWHALNNAAALVPDRLGWLDGGATIPVGIYLLALVGLALAFAILWAYRRPYPRRGGFGAPSPEETKASQGPRSKLR